ncbi:MAG: trypsin-like peptidase domain-containing protein [Christensenellaceae bacterium]|jgi:serine protease Do|nr:trypsin-like peptidase domain-containing protein [Christensenellaceae bacterium]
MEHFDFNESNEEARAVEAPQAEPLQQEQPPLQEDSQAAAEEIAEPQQLLQEDGYAHARPHFAKELPRKPKKRGGAGGYVAVGAVCLLIGFALGCMLMALVSFGTQGWVEPGERPSAGDDFFGGFFKDNTKPGANPAPEYVAPEDVQAPGFIARPLPEFDGEAPVIENSINPLPDIVESAANGVVGISVYYHDKVSDSDHYEGYGSGFVVSTEGYIVTNAHVVQDASRVTVTCYDGEVLDAEVIGMDNGLDVAVIKIEKSGLVALALGSSQTVRVGEFAVAIGNPTGEELADTATFGIISSTARETTVEGHTNTFLQTDAAVNPGSSGGPLLDMSGHVVGITCAKTLYAGYDEYGNIINAEGLGYAIPIDDAMRVVRQLITIGHVVRPGLGISIMSITKADSEVYDVPQGILVYTVTRNGPAHHADLRINDIILKYDGTPVTDDKALVAYIKGLEPGASVVLDVWRDGEELSIELTIGDINLLSNEILNDAYADIFD